MDNTQKYTYFWPPVSWDTFIDILNNSCWKKFCPLDDWEHLRIPQPFPDLCTLQDFQDSTAVSPLTLLYENFVAPHYCAFCEASRTQFQATLLTRSSPTTARFPDATWQPTLKKPVLNVVFYILNSAFVTLSFERSTPVWRRGHLSSWDKSRNAAQHRKQLKNSPRHDKHINRRLRLWPSWHDKHWPLMNTRLPLGYAGGR